MKIVISSGHGLKIRGAAGPAPWGLDEVNEARKVVEQTAKVLRGMGVEVTTWHDDKSTTQDQNLAAIVSAHNSAGPHTYDVSVHFNAYEVTTTKKMGAECCYISQKELAAKVSSGIAKATSLPDRGPKERTELYFLRHTNEPAILVETLFCDAKLDCDSYRANFNAICTSIAESLAGETTVPMPPPKPEIAFHAIGKCSYFGGPGDTTGMTADEPLAFLYKQGDKPEVFLPGKPLDAQALGRDLNPHTHYLACRWDYDVTSKSMLAGKQVALVRAPATSIALTAMPSDWGPNSATGRIADLSPSLMADLQIATDDEVEITYPYDPPKVA